MANAKKDKRSAMFSAPAESIETYALGKLAVAERLLATQDRWCKGALRDGPDRYCILGALDAAGARYLLAPVVLRAAREVSGKHYWRVESFNDDRRTTHADVLRALRHARDAIAAGTVQFGYAEPWPHRCGRALRALCARSAASLKPHLARLAGGFDRMFLHAPEAAK
jgi:hypothetical protein